MKTLSFFFITIAMTSLSCGSSPIELSTGSIDGGGDAAIAVVGNFHLDKDKVLAEYGAWVRSNYPRQMWQSQFADKAAIRNYIERVALQALLVDAFKNEGTMQGKDVELLAIAGTREALAETYLRSKVDLAPVVSSKPFSEMNDAMVDRLYKENRKKYDDEKIDEATAKQSLRIALVGKKKEILENYLTQSRFNIIRELIKKSRYDIRVKD